MKEKSQSNILDQFKDKIYLIAGDASPRKFYRFKSKKQLLPFVATEKWIDQLGNRLQINS